MTSEFQIGDMVTDGDIYDLGLLVEQKKSLTGVGPFMVGGNIVWRVLILKRRLPIFFDALASDAGGGYRYTSERFLRKLA